MIYFLIGYMGSGKSTLGKVLARRTGFSFVDMDAEIERRHAKTISEIFAEHGEEHFRRAERGLIDEIVHGRFVSPAEVPIFGDGNSAAHTQTSEKTSNVIVATGGGAPCFGDNMERMKSRGCVIYLKMSPRKLVGRLKYGKAKRPKIAGMNDDELLTFIESNLEVRAPYYEQASMIIDCEGVSDDYICRHVEGFIDYNSGKGG